MKNSITLTESIFVQQSPEVVWDFTQNYSLRSKWDHSIIHATTLQDAPSRIIEIQAMGNLRCKFQYKQDDRPSKTTLAMINISSSILLGGGGSWKYEPVNNGTLWTQTNTLILKNHFWLKWIKPLIALQLRRSTQNAMKRAKRMMEP